MKKIISLLLAVLISVSMIVTVSAETSTSFRFPEKREAVLEKYGDYALLFDEELSCTAIPGMEQTQMSDGSVCTEMVPQGMCFAKDLILITAYDYTKEYNSVIYIVSSLTGKLLSVIELPEKNHVGGIAFDGENVYVARSSKASLGVISFTKIAAAALLTDTCKLEYDAKIDCYRDASFVTCYDGKIWVGTFKQYELSELYGYILENDALVQTDKIYLPRKTQGAAFFEEDSKTYIAASTSYGRNNNSKLVLFSLEGNEKTYEKHYILPPLTQEIDVKDGMLYLMTEAPATQYTSTDCKNTDFTVDRISVCTTEKLVNLEPENSNALLKFFNDLFYNIGTAISNIMIMF